MIEEPECGDECTCEVRSKWATQEVKRLREENEYFRGLLDHYKRECIDKHEEIQRYHKVFYDCVMNLSAAHQKETEQLREIINKAMQQHTVLDMREQLFESQCIDAEGQYESGHWEREEE